MAVVTEEKNAEAFDWENLEFFSFQTPTNAFLRLKSYIKLLYAKSMFPKGTPLTC